MESVLDSGKVFIKKNRTCMNFSKLFALCFALVCSAYAQRQDKPNVILFLVDDLGYTDLGVTGSTFYETPRLDALARNGVFF